jgi:hypothetical protein
VGGSVCGDEHSNGPRLDGLSVGHSRQYNPGGLLGHTAVIPGFVALLAVSGIVPAFTLGAPTAVLLNRAVGLV